MKGKRMLLGASITVGLAVLVTGAEISAQVQDRYSVRVSNGLAFSEFRGYEG
jgi:hypothetical protein